LKFEIAITMKQQILYHRSASMAHQTEHDFRLKVSFPKPVRRVLEWVYYFPKPYPKPFGGD
ncbi:unnamed protein product, partial [Rotaria magnacalcarata]